jgi:hypothetical protein
MRFLIFTITAFALLSCSKTTDKNSNAASDSLKLTIKDSVSNATAIDYDSYLKVESYVVPDQTDTSTCYVIDHDCAVIVNPTDKQIDEMIKLNGEDDFATIADDFSYYQSMAMQMIDSVGIKSESFEKQYVKFIGEKKSWTLDVRKQNMPAWNIIFFKKNKDPEIISAIDLTSNHVRDYFEVKK